MRPLSGAASLVVFKGAGLESTLMPPKRSTTFTLGKHGDCPQVSLVTNDQALIDAVKALKGLARKP